MRTSKERRRQAAIQWIGTLDQERHSELVSSAQDLCNALTEAQLQIFNQVMAAMYGRGCDETREHSRSMRQDRHNAPVFARRSAFKLIAGGQS